MVANPKKHTQNDQIFTKTHPHVFRSKLNQKNAIKFEEKAIRKTEIRKKQAQKNEQISVEASPKSKQPASLQKKTAIPQKKHKVAGKSQRWQH